MPVIRWLGCYGFFRSDSFEFELKKNKREVAAEWTISNRPFILNGIGIGLLVKTSAVVKRFKFDASTSLRMDGINLSWRYPMIFKKELLETHAWEAICKPEYSGIVICEDAHHHVRVLAEDACIIYNLPMLIYQAYKNSDGVNVKFCLMRSRISDGAVSKMSEKIGQDGFDTARQVKK